MSWGHVLCSLLVTGPLVYSSSTNLLSQFLGTWFTKKTFLKGRFIKKVGRNTVVGNDFERGPQSSVATSYWDKRRACSIESNGRLPLLCTWLSVFYLMLCSSVTVSFLCLV
jgi:hypothetical protein